MPVSVMSTKLSRKSLCMKSLCECARSAGGAVEVGLACEGVGLNSSGIGSTGMGIGFTGAGLAAN